MRFWDSSAIVPLLSNQPASGTITRLLREDTEIAVWWGAWVESAVAVSRLKREGRLNDDGEDEARATLDQLAEAWSEVRPTEEVRLLASLISREHPLKAADALQLAAALRWCGGETRGKSFVCLDERLRRTAQDEGFDVLPELNEEAR